MRWASAGSLRVRIIGAVVGAAVAFSLLAGTLAYQLGHHRAGESAHQTLEDLANAVEKTAAVAAYTQDALLLREVADGLARNALIARVQIRTPGGAQLLPAGPSAGPANDATAELTVERALKAPFDAKETIAVLRIEADRDQLERSARSQAWLLAGAMVAQTLLVAYVLYLVAARLVSVPLVRLAQELRSMTPGTSDRMKPPRRGASDEMHAVVGSANDLLAATEHALARERELRAEVEAMEAQYRQIFDSTSAGIFVLDAQGRLINGNPTVLKAVGAAGRDMRRLRGHDFLDQVFVRPERARAMIEDAVRRGETVSDDLELRTPDGVARWVHCLISVQAQPPGESEARERLVEGVMYDITERKRHEHDVRHRAEHDALTGLKNRLASEAAIDRFVAEAEGHHGEFVLMYLDLDGFKQVNDRLGHKAGDRVLVQCAQRMRAAVKRSTDLVGRLGGDEFVIALQHTAADDDSVAAIAQALVAALCEPVDLAGHGPVQVGASIGIAAYPRHGASRRLLVQAADEAMYRVKRGGRNGFAMAVAPVGDGLETRPAALA